VAWIEDHQRAAAGLSYVVCWRLGGTRTGKRQRETFGAGSDERNKAQAEGVLRMVVAAGESWPDGWIKGQGFVREKSHVKEPDAAPRRFHDVGLDYVNQIVGCSPGQRSRYRSQIRLLDTLEVKGPSMRLHSTILYNSVYRADDDVLVNSHIYGTPAAKSPVMHLRRVTGGTMVSTYLDSFDRVWSEARPLD
jgi:hypothetical protein